MRNMQGVRGGFGGVGAVVLVAAALWGCSPPPPPQAGKPQPTALPPSPPQPAPTASAGRGKPDLSHLIELARERQRRDETFRSARVKSLGFADGGLCYVPPPIAESDIDVDKSLWIHDRPTLDFVDPSPPANVPASFSLRDTLGQLARQARTAGAPATLDAVALFKQLRDTQNSDALGVTTGPHCGAELNDFPAQCGAEKSEAAQAGTQIDKYWPIGLVNRMDLAEDGWRNCGEFRIVYGRKDVTSQMLNTGATGRAFIIFEGLLPNPRPGCRSACQPVEDYWASLSTSALSTDDRARKLRDFFYVGLPGFDPVVHINHYTAEGVASSYGTSGGGQIRTNSFIGAPWMLKEFRLSFDCGVGGCDLVFVPTMVKVNPEPRLFLRENAVDPTSEFFARAADFQATLTDDIPALAGNLGAGCPSGGGDIMNIGYPVDVRFDGAQSATIDGGFGGLLANDYPRFATFQDSSHTSLVSILNGAPGRCGLTGAQLVSRAQALSCAGCHDNGAAFSLQVSGSIGPVLRPDGPSTTWPASLGFVHTLETPGADHVHALSPALEDVFLPKRRSVMVGSVLNKPHCQCKETFTLVDPPRLQAAVSLEDKVTAKVLPELEKEITRLKALTNAGSPNSPQAAEVRKIRARIAALERKREDARTKELTAAGIELPPLDPKRAPQSTQLGLRSLAAVDSRRASALRTKLTLELLRQEPPRRTVTGSFWVH